MRNHTPSQLSQIPPRAGETKHRAMTTEGECTPVRRWRGQGGLRSQEDPSSNPDLCAVQPQASSLTSLSLSFFLSFSAMRINETRQWMHQHGVPSPRAGLNFKVRSLSPK